LTLLYTLRQSTSDSRSDEKRLGSSFGAGELTFVRNCILPFLDTPGNAYLEAPGLTVYVTGEPRPADLQGDMRYKAFTPAGMKIVFVMLCERGATEFA
jgi:hypothetical protein